MAATYNANLQSGDTKGDPPTSTTYVCVCLPQRHTPPVPEDAETVVPRPEHSCVAERVARNQRCAHAQAQLHEALPRPVRRWDGFLGEATLLWVVVVVVILVSFS